MDHNILLLFILAATYASVFWTWWFFNQLASHCFKQSNDRLTLGIDRNERIYLIYTINPPKNWQTHAKLTNRSYIQLIDRHGKNIWPSIKQIASFVWIGKLRGWVVEETAEEGSSKRYLMESMVERMLVYDRGEWQMRCRELRCFGNTMRVWGGGFWCIACLDMRWNKYSCVSSKKKLWYCEATNCGF